MYSPANVKHFLIEDDGCFPNNNHCPLLLYPQAAGLSGSDAAISDAAASDAAASIEELFDRNQWPSAWRNGVYGFHHYHSTAHEVLGVYSGSAKVQFGGEQGIVCDVQAGDVVVIPAGVSHKKLNASGDFRVVGAYPAGQSPDMCYGKKGERPQADSNIDGVPKPEFDPALGESGPLLDLWINRE